MKQALIISINKDRKVEKIRKKYVKDYKKFKPHISLVYTFEVNNQEELKTHIKNSIKNIKPFELTLQGLRKSAKDYYLYLLVKKGRKQITQLYKNLNSGILKNFKNKDMPVYIPHISLGVFNSKKEIDESIKKIRKENPRIEMKASFVQLLTLNKDNSIKLVKRFKLK
jgi:2'-5' RNA ligase